MGLLNAWRLHSKCGEVLPHEIQIETNTFTNRILSLFLECCTNTPGRDTFWRKAKINKLDYNFFRSIYPHNENVS